MYMYIMLIDIYNIHILSIFIKHYFVRLQKAKKRKKTYKKKKKKKINRIFPEHENAQ